MDERENENKEILEGIELYTIGLERVGINIECLANAHQGIAERIQDLQIRKLQENRGKEEREKEEEEWKNLQNRIDELWLIMEEEEQQENQAIWARDDFQVAALGSAKGVRALKKGMKSLQEKEDEEAGDSDSDMDPDDWESSEEGEQEAGSQDQDWENGSGGEWIPKF